MDIEKIRRDTPFCKDKIFLNSAGSSLSPNSVNEKIKEYLDIEEQLGGYKVAALRKSEIDLFYSEAAKVINCSPRNIAFTHDATDAYIKALSSINFIEKDVIITTNDDYASNQIQFISLQKRFGIEVLKIRNFKNGDLDIDHFEQLVRQSNPKLVAVTHIPTNSGLVQNVEEIGNICHQQEITYLVDACQSVGQIKVDVKNIKCDFLSTTGRKWLRGPRGTGFLYVSDRILRQGQTPLFADGYGGKWTEDNHFEILESAKRFQTWEAPYALMVGFGKALRYANDLGIINIQDYNAGLIKRLRNNLSVISGTITYDNGSTTSNILTFRKEGRSLDEIEKHLGQQNIFYSVSTRQWGLIDFRKKDVDWVIRLSPHYFNTIEEMDKVAEIVDGI